MTPAARPGGQLDIRWYKNGANVELYLQDKDHGGGTRIQFATAAWAQVFLDDLERTLAELCTDEVLGS